jgi:hypothetical protein
VEDLRVQSCQQPTLHTSETVDADHGRVETRTYWITSDLDWLGAKPAWANLQSLGMVEARRELPDKTETETRFYLTSLPRCLPKQCGAIGTLKIASMGCWIPRSRGLTELIDFMR